MKISKFLFIPLLVLGLGGCSLATRPLTKEQRKSDLDWVFAIFDRNYAPLDYKKTRNIDFETVKKECYQKAEVEQSIDEFRLLLFECVSRFQDGHTKAFQSPASLDRGDATVAYLGFAAERAKLETDLVSPKTGQKAKFKGDVLKVLRLLPTTKADGFTVKVGDLIIGIDGKPVDQVLEEQIVPQIDVGQKEANLTIAAFSFAARTSLANRLPKEDSVSLSVARGDKVQTIRLPWIKRDHYEFIMEQRAAAAELAKKKPVPKTPNADDVDDKDKEKEKDKDRGVTVSDGVREYVLNGEGYGIFGNGNLLSESGLLGLIPTARNFSIRFLLSSYRFFEVNGFKSELKRLLGDTADDKKIDRTIPQGAHEIPNKSFLAYKITKPLMTDKGADSGEKVKVAYIRIPSFNIEAQDLKEFAKIVADINEDGIKRVIIDMLDNPGGSLLDGLRLANMLSAEPIEYPAMQVSLSDTWLRSVNETSIYADTDSEREWASRLSKRLRAETDQGKRLSSPISLAELDPFAHDVPKKDFLNKDVGVVVLVNEMCASMCDTFAAVVQDQKLGIVLGTKSMGAGGIVRLHPGSPSSSIFMNQTESLLMRKNGTYLENNGVDPDVVVETVGEGGTKKYATVIAAAMKALTTKRTAAPDKDDKKRGLPVESVSADETAPPANAASL